MNKRVAFILLEVISFCFWGLLLGYGLTEVKTYFAELDKKEVAFYKSCMQDHKIYECDAMWASARRLF